MAEKCAKSTCRVLFVKASRALDSRRPPICTLDSWPNQKTSLPRSPPPRPSMTAAEATVEAMVAHGIGTIYALPGVQND